MASRVTQAPRRVLISVDAVARVTQAPRRVLISVDAVARVTQMSRRALVADYATPGKDVSVTILD